MYREVTIKDGLLKYWEAEQTAPLWFREDMEEKNLTKDIFLGFCEQCWKIFEMNGDSLLYVEKIGNNANIHFSLMRKAQVPMDDLKVLKTLLLSQFDMVFGWVAKHNRGLRKVCEDLGLRDYGLRMYQGENRGRVTEWRCYSINSLNMQ